MGRLVHGLGVVALIALLATSCAVAETIAPDTVAGQGPQGRQPQFVVDCGFSHAAPDDPIVAPGRPGASHVHVFFGNVTIDADSTQAGATDDDTTCDQALDTASYWAPALLSDSRMIEPTRAIAYYRPGPGIDPASVEAYPYGLKMVAGDADATSPQPIEIAAWSCGTGSARTPTPQPCPDGRPLRMVIVFPDCWDGQHLDSQDHISHVTYSQGGRCPRDFRVPIPQLQLSVEYPVTGDVGDLSLTSGDLITAHADFWNLWDPDKLQTEVELCLNRGVVCGVIQ